MSLRAVSMTMQHLKIDFTGQRDVFSFLWGTLGLYFDVVYFKTSDSKEVLNSWMCLMSSKKSIKAEARELDLKETIPTPAVTRDKQFSPRFKTQSHTLSYAYLVSSTLRLYKLFFFNILNSAVILQCWSIPINLKMPYEDSKYSILICVFFSSSHILYNDFTSDTIWIQMHLFHDHLKPCEQPGPPLLCHPHLKTQQP